MCLLTRYPPPVHLSHRFFYRHGSTTSLVVRRKTGPGANPARYYELKTAAHTEPMSSQKQIDAHWGRPSACQFLTPSSCLPPSFCVPNFAEQSQFRSTGLSIEFSMSCSTFLRRPIRSGRPIAPVSWLLFSHPTQTS